MVNILVKPSIWASGSTAPLMVSIPNIRTANPIRIVPTSFFFSFWENIRKTMPITASMGEKEEGLSICSRRLDPSIPVRLNSQEVTVVPMLAPMITPTAWDSCIMPEFTNPTTITVVAEEDWITAVTTSPSSTPINRLEVSFSRSRSMRPPDSLDSPSPMALIPYRNRASPPSMVKKSNTSIFFPLFCHFSHRLCL